jgi:SPP1 family predicted phage head-tail adaptor
MNPGPMRHRIAFQTYSETKLAGGQRQKAWTTVYTCWSRIRTADGRKFTNDDRQKSAITHVIELRNPRSLSLTPDMRVLYGARTFNIKQIIDPENIGRILNLHCAEVVMPPRTP